MYDHMLNSIFIRSGSGGAPIRSRVQPVPSTDSGRREAPDLGPDCMAQDVSHSTVVKQTVPAAALQASRTIRTLVLVYSYVLFCAPGVCSVVPETASLNVDVRPVGLTRQRVWYNYCSRHKRVRALLCISWHSCSDHFEMDDATHPVAF